ncbi:MAG: ABC transporter substrate-binding protein [Candidatus Bathyarchaeia archaeon]
MKETKRLSKNTLIIIIIGVVILASIGIGALYIQEQKKTGQYSGPIDQITVAAYAGEAGALIYIAEDQGYFDKYGLNVTIKSYESGKECADVLIDGEADISTSAGFVFVSNSFNYSDIRVLGTIATAEVKELIARKDKGITTTDDLLGKRIGVTRKSGAEFQLGVFLTLNGLSQQDVEFVDLKPSEMLDAISNSDVDAVFTWDPNVYYIKKELGENVVSFPGGENFYFILLTKENWINNNPAAAERFIKSLLEAENYIKDNPEETKNFAKNRFDYDSDYIDYSWPKQEFAVILSQAMLITFDDQARWRIEHELTDALDIPNYLDYIYMDALDEVKPEANTIIR